MSTSDSSARPAPRSALRPAKKPLTFDREKIKIFTVRSGLQTGPVRLPGCSTATGLQSTAD